MTRRRVTPYRPTDVACPVCGAGPRISCRSVVHVTRSDRRRPHGDRVTAARLAERDLRADRAGGITTDAWSCPVCSTSYRCPAGWEQEVWLAARRAAQLEHAERHHG